MIKIDIFCVCGQLTGRHTKMENFQDQGQRLQCSATTSHLYPSCISLPFRHKMDAYAMFREGWNCEKIVNSMLRIEVSWCLQKSWFKMHLWDKYMLSFQRDLSDFKLHVSPDLILTLSSIHILSTSPSVRMEGPGDTDFCLCGPLFFPSTWKSICKW